MIIISALLKMRFETMVSNEELAELLFPEITTTIEDLEKRFPLRQLPEGAQVTRGSFTE